MGNIDRSRLAKELEPYIASQIRSMLNAALTRAALPTLKAGGGGGVTPPPPLASHVLATATALGAYHTIAGATAGHVLRASASNAAAFAQLLHSDLGNVTADQHHNQSHAYDSADHTGSLSWAKINFTGSSLGDLATRNYAQLNSRTHDIIGGDHSYTGGAALDVFGLSAANTLAKLTPSDSVSSAQTAILKATNGALSIDALTAAAKVRAPLLDTAGVAHMTVAPGGRLILSPAEWVQLTDGKTFRTESFSSGFVGNGMRLDQGVAEAGRTTIEVDNLWVRGRMHVYELLIHQIRATNGSIFVSNTGKVVDVSGSGPYTLTTDPEHGFAVGDLIRAQRFTGTGVYQCNMQVTSVTSTKVFVATLSSGDAPAAGMDFARLGSASDANRRGGLYLTADDSGAPFMDIFDGVSSFATWNTPGVIKSRLGKLDGLGLPGSYTGEYGFYAGNGTTDTDAYVRLSNKTSRFNNVPLAMWSGGVQVGQWSSNGQLDIGFNGITTPADRDFTVHASGYVRIGRVGANKPNLIYTAGGDLHLRSNTTPVITLAGDGNSYFSGVMTIGASGGIYQGSGSFAAPTTGLKIWNESGIGRIAGYNGGVYQVGFTSSGVLTAGAGAAILDADGVTIVSGGKVESTLEPLPPAGYAWGYDSTWATTNALTFAIPGYAADFFDVSMWAYTNTYPDNASIQSQRDVRLRMIAPSRAYGLLARMVVGVNNSGMDIIERTDGWTSTLPDIHGVHIKVASAQRLIATASGVDMYGAVTTSSAMAVGGALTVDGTITAQAGTVALDVSSGTYRGLSMRAFVGATWAFGLTYRNAAGAMLGSWAAYGGADALTYLYSGINYNDTTLRVYPATDRVGIGANVVPSFTLDVAGDVNATGTFRRNGTEGNILIFIPPFNLTDTGSTTWGGVTRAAGSYHFDVQLNGNGLPDATRGVLVWLSGTWSGANNSYYCALYQYGSSTLVGNIRAYASAISIDAQISVPLDASGRFTATVAGAVSMTNSYMRIIGYYI